MRTTDERDRDFERHREILRRLDAIDERLRIIEQQVRSRQAGQAYRTEGGSDSWGS